MPLPSGERTVAPGRSHKRLDLERREISKSSARTIGVPVDVLARGRRARSSQAGDKPASRCRAEREAARSHRWPVAGTAVARPAKSQVKVAPGSPIVTALTHASERSCGQINFRLGGRREARQSTRTSPKSQPCNWSQERPREAKRGHSGEPGECWRATSKVAPQRVARGLATDVSAPLAFGTPHPVLSALETGSSRHSSTNGANSITPGCVAAAGMAITRPRSQACWPWRLAAGSGRPKKPGAVSHATRLELQDAVPATRDATARRPMRRRSRATWLMAKVIRPALASSAKAWFRESLEFNVLSNHVEHLIGRGRQRGRARDQRGRRAGPRDSHRASREFGTKTPRQAVRSALSRAHAEEPARRAQHAPLRLAQPQASRRGAAVLRRLARSVLERDLARGW